MLEGAEYIIGSYGDREDGDGSRGSVACPRDQPSPPGFSSDKCQTRSGARAATSSCADARTSVYSHPTALRTCPKLCYNLAIRADYQGTSSPSCLKNLPELFVVAVVASLSSLATDSSTSIIASGPPMSTLSSGYVRQNRGPSSLPVFTQPGSTTYTIKSGRVFACLYACQHRSGRSHHINGNNVTHEHVQCRLADTVRRILCPEVEPDARQPARHVYDHLPPTLLEQRQIHHSEQRRPRHVRPQRVHQAIVRKTERRVIPFRLCTHIL